MNTKILLSTILWSFTLLVNAQQSGQVEYTEIMKPEMDMPEIEGLPEGMNIDMSAFMPDSIVTYMTLSFNNSESLYAESDSKKDMKTENNASFESMDDDSQVHVTMEIMGDESTTTIYQSSEDTTQLVQTSFMGQKFLITKSKAPYTWKFHTDKINYLGYECSKATTSDSEGEEIVVWYTSQIPTAIGPGEYSGLPGLILMASADGGNYQIKASSVDLKSTPEIKEPKGGKKVSGEEFEEIQEEKIKEMEKMFQGLDGDNENMIIIRN